MEAKIFLAVSLTILQLCACTLQVAAAQPSPAPGAEQRCSSRCPVQKKPISVSESREPPLHCTKAEGQCLLELISKLKQVEEEITHNLRLLFAKSPESVKLGEFVRQCEQDVACLEYRLSELRQTLVSTESNNEKLVKTFSYDPDLVAMVDRVNDKVSEALAAITHFGYTVASCSTVYDNSLIAHLENFAVEVALAISMVEEAKGLIFAKNSIFGVYREVDKLKRISLDAARKHPTRYLGVCEQTTELVGSLNDQLFQLRRATDLLKSTIKDSSPSGVVVEHLQRIMNLVNREEQQTAWLNHLIVMTRHSLVVARSSLMSMSETPGKSLSALAVRLTKFESYRNSLLQSQALTPQVIDHTLDLLVQLDLLLQTVRKYTIPEVTEPLSRLDEISNAVRSVQRTIDNNIILHGPLTLLQTDLAVLTGFNSLLLQNIPLAQDIEFQNRAHLSQYGNYLRVTLDTLSLLARNILSEVEDKNIELQQQVDKLSTSVMLVNGRVNVYQERIRNIELFSAHLLKRLQETPQIASDTERVLEALPSQFSTLIEQQNALGNKVIDGASVDLNDAFAQIHLTSTTIELAEGIVNRLWNLLDQVSLPVQFSNDTVLTFDPKGNLPTYLTTANWEFQSVSFSMRKTGLGDCTIIQLSETWQLMGHNISMVIGVINGRITANLEFSHPIGGIESISLNIDEKNITLNEEFLVEVSRTDQNVHLFLHDIKSNRMYCTSGAIPSILSSFFRGRSSRSKMISLGGATIATQWNAALLEAGNFSGCLSEILLNGENVNLWSLASSIQADFQPCSSSEVTLSELKLSCNGDEYAQATILQGKLLPLEFSFSTFHRNGILLHASDVDDMARFIQVSLISGHVVTTIMASDKEQITLTSDRTYANGANQFFSLSMSFSEDMHMLTLRTPLEETSVKMTITEIGPLVNNLTDVFVCGVPRDLVNTSREFSNFTGCAALSSGVKIDPLPLNCNFDNQVKPCSFCLNEAVYSASFYGASYALFAPINVKTHFDIRFSFVTSFPDGLLLHSGNASRGHWFDVVIVNGRLELLFGSPFGALSLPTRTRPLNDLMRHTVTIEVNTGSTIDILIDGDSAGNFPFGSFFPVGTLNPVLSVGGIAPSIQELVLPGVTNEGFKGCLDHLYVLGQPLDFSESEDAAQVNFKISNESQTVDTFLFDGNGYARYDLGRFDPDFNLGLQLCTASSAALLLYMEDAFALQIVNGEVGMIISDNKTGSIIAISSNVNVSDNIWHSVVVIKSGSHVQLLVDSQVTTETSAAPTQIIGSSSDLFIGGTSSNEILAVPEVTEKRFKGEMRMAFLEHSIQSGGIQRTIQTT